MLTMILSLAESEWRRPVNFSRLYFESGTPSGVLEKAMFQTPPVRPPYPPLELEKNPKLEMDRSL